MNALDLIARSISHTEITHAEWTEQRAADLLAESDDSVENADQNVIEYWGTDEDGNEWRVHLDTEGTDAD